MEADQTKVNKDTLINPPTSLKDPKKIQDSVEKFFYNFPAKNSSR